MQVPLSWLSKYVPVSLPPRDLAHLLTMAGNEVSEVRETGVEWERDKIIVGEVLGVERHPNADRLTLPTVGLGGGETATVVCGAPNVSAGQKIAFAREGARLFSARSQRIEPLRPAKIRGVLSTGMVCSEYELGLGEDHAGILLLDEGAPVGTPLVDYLGDAVLDIEVTPNRPDCLSILGIAHEVAALTGEAVTEPDPVYPEEGDPIEGQVTVEIADPHLCSRYDASLVFGAKVGPSPRWLQDALVRADQRPINNIVDVTNYVMLEYGQPLHAFDFDLIKGGKVIVRAARPEEVLATLDGETHKLKPPMLTIADATDAIALAGVMGGAATEVRDNTVNILLEAANFDAINTRRTAAALRLSTGASYRFERGIRADLVTKALRRATQLILQIAGGQAARGIVDQYPGRAEPPVITITDRRIKQVLGVEYEIDQVRSVLGSLGFTPVEEPSAADAVDAGGVLHVKAPYWRSDVAIEEDLIEEVVRIVGYDTVPTTMLSTPVPHHEPQPLRALKERLRDLLVASGLQEVISYSLTNRDVLARAGALPGGPEPLRIANPLSSEMGYLRTTLRGSLLRTLGYNRRMSHDEGIRVFEIGRVYLPKGSPEAVDLPDEKEMLVGLLSGPRSPTSWLTSPGEMDFFDAKGILDHISERLSIEVVLESSPDPFLHSGKAADILCSDTAIGVIGEIHPGVLERFDLSGVPVAMFEIDLEALRTVLPDTMRSYAAASRFPESERDLALVVDPTVPSATIQSVIERSRLVARSIPIDVYTGEQIEAGKKSIAYRVVFQSPSGTLTAEQVNNAQAEILRQLQRQVGATLRE